MADPEFPPNSFTKREEESFEDYTAVTDWEKFTQDLENVLTRWELKADGDVTIRQHLLSTSTPTQSGYLCGLLHFGEREFQLVLYNTGAELDLKPTETIFYTDPTTDSQFVGSGCPPLFWFDLKRALIIRPTEGHIKGGTRLNLLLSSVEMAVHAVRCPLPILVEYFGTSSSYYYGVGAIPPLPDRAGDRTKEDYASCMLIGALNVDFATGLVAGTVDPSCTHLSGIRDMFLAKLGWPSSVNCIAPQVDVSARFIYQLPFWPSLDVHPPTDYALFTFDRVRTCSVSPFFHLATVWNDIPSHTILRSPSWKVLKPEGASDWYLQVFVNTCPDRLSSRLRHLVKACRENASYTSTSGASLIYSSMTSRLSWLGADLPRLKSMFTKSRRNPSPESQPVHTNAPVVPSEAFEWTGEKLLQCLLFVFPDADASFASSAAIAEELCCLADFELDLLNWSRELNRASSKVLNLASVLGLPSPLSLSHRLSLVLCNLYLIQSERATDTRLNLVQSFFSEFILELKLRLDRNICLPLERNYRSSEQNVANSGDTDPSDLDDFSDTPILDKPPLTESVGLVPTSVQEPFSQWPEQMQCKLDLLLERFNRCIEKVKNGENADDNETTKNDPDDLFFDAMEQLSTSATSDSPSNRSSDGCGSVEPDTAMEEAKKVLNWLQQLDQRAVLCLILPGVCLESLITLHSLTIHSMQLKSDHYDHYSQNTADSDVTHIRAEEQTVLTSSLLSPLFPRFEQLDGPHPRLKVWYAKGLKRLDKEVYEILRRLNKHQASLDGYKTDNERLIATYCDVLEVTANFGERVSCLEELIQHYYVNANPVLSDECLSFLGQLALNAVCGHSSWSPSLDGWVKVTEMERHRRVFFSDFKKLFGLRTDSDSERVFSPPTALFRFSSSSQSWFNTSPPMDLQHPSWETYRLSAPYARPNPLSSRTGPQRLCVDLSFDRLTKAYDRCLLAGTFSHDTQFF